MNKYTNSIEKIDNWRAEKGWQCDQRCRKCLVSDYTYMTFLPAEGHAS